MKERFKIIIKWFSSNLAWDILKIIARWIVLSFVSCIGSNYVIEKVPRLVKSANEFFISIGISLTGNSLVFIVIFLAIFGVISFFSTPISLIWRYLVRSDRPNLVRGEGGNYIVDHNNSKIGIGIIGIKNDPRKKTDKSTAYGVSARIEFSDRNDKHILTVKRGYWTRDPAIKFFPEYGKIKQCGKVDFYTYNPWSLVAIYKFEDNDTVFAYDPTRPLMSKKIGKMPIKIRIFIEGENYKSRKSLNYILVPQPSGLEGFWIKVLGM